VQTAKSTLHRAIPRLISITTTSLALDRKPTSLRVSLALRLCFDIIVLGCSYKILSSYTSNHFLSSFRGPLTLSPTSFSGLEALTPLMVVPVKIVRFSFLSS
jgi:hypothetical protein